MSRKTEIYQHYLEKWHKDHPNVIQPTTYGGFSSRPFSDLITTNSVTLRENTAFNEKVLQLPDGKIAHIKHVGCNQSIPIARVWPNKEAWQNYAEPLSPNSYWEG